jgi:hypothetical protein
MSATVRSTHVMGACLDQVQERFNAGADYPLAGTAKAITDSSDDVPRLHAALVAVLALAGEWAALAPPDDWGETPYDTVRADAGRAIQAAISAALLGEERRT